MREGWYHFTSKEEAERTCKKIGMPDYLDVKWDGPGWYYCDTQSRYFRGGAWDIYTVAVTAEQREENVNEKIRELWSERREARSRRSN